MPALMPITCQTIYKFSLRRVEDVPGRGQFADSKVAAAIKTKVQAVTDSCLAVQC